MRADMRHQRRSPWSAGTGRPACGEPARTSRLGRWTALSCEARRVHRLCRAAAGAGRAAPNAAPVRALLCARHPRALPGAQARQQQARAARAGKGSSLASGLRMLARSRLFTKLTVCVMTVGALRRRAPACQLLPAALARARCSDQGMRAAPAHELPAPARGAWNAAAGASDWPGAQRVLYARGGGQRARAQHPAPLPVVLDGAGSRGPS
jgi:hypothetical protein